MEKRLYLGHSIAITQLGHGILQTGSRLLYSMIKPEFMVLQYLRMAASWQAHRLTTQLNYGTSTTTSPSVRPSSMQLQWPLCHFLQMESY
jgi:hypothetical protein